MFQKMKSSSKSTDLIKIEFSDLDGVSEKLDFKKSFSILSIFKIMQHAHCVLRAREGLFDSGFNVLNDGKV